MNAPALMPPSQGNRHHNLPRSQGGSSDKRSNITVFDEHEHNAFHAFADHPAPCGFIRLLVARSLSAESRTMAPGAVEDLFAALTLPDWRAAYAHEALRIVDGKPEHERYLALAAYHISRQIHDELGALLDAHGALGLSQYAPPSSQNYVARAKHHFGVATVPEAVSAFMTAENAKGELKYAKPFAPGVRSAVLSVLRHARAEQLDDADRVRLMRVVTDQRRLLLGRSSLWKPGISTLIDLCEHDATAPALPRVVHVA